MTVFGFQNEYQNKCYMNSIPELNLEKQLSIWKQICVFCSGSVTLSWSPWLKKSTLSTASSGEWAALSSRLEVDCLTRTCVNWS